MAPNIPRPRALPALFATAVLATLLLALVGANPAWAADRTFTPAPNSPFAVGSTPTTVTNADFDGDGKVDLAVSNFGDPANSDPGSVSVLLGNGDGTFQAKQDFPAGTGPSSVNSADFNKDGIADLAVSNQRSSKVSVLLGKDDGSGKGDGTFQAPVDFPVGSIPSSVASADFNGDGKADLAISNYGQHTVSVLLGNGDGTFQEKQDYGVSVAGVNPNEVITADFNGDGKTDLATANIGTELARALGGVAVLLGNGDGTFNAASKAMTQAFNTSVASADFNGDGKKDLVATGPVCCALGAVSVALGNGDGTFQTPQGFRVWDGHSSPNSVASADFDKDGDQDLAVSNSANKVSLLWGSGNGSFSQPSREFPAGGSSPFVLGADFNADSYADLAVANQNSNNVSVLLNTPPTPGEDLEPPTTTRSLSPEPNAAGWNKGDVTLTLSATDDASGVKQISYSTNGSEPITVQQSSVQIPVTDEGTTTISYFATDNAGKEESPAKTVTVKIDKSAPSMSSVSPDNGVTGVAPTANVTATFSEAMDPATLVSPLNSPAPAFTLKAPNGSSVPAAVSYDADSKTATLNPGSDLAANTIYAATVTTGAKDAAGNTLAQDHGWTFTTAAPPPDTTAPVATAPAQSFPTASTLGTSTVPVQLAWSATDNTGGSGVASYQLQRSVNGGSYSNVTLPSATTTTITPSLTPGSTYRYRVAAKDKAGNVSARATGPSFRVTAYQETSSAIADTGTWTTSALSGAYGGSVQYASALGRNAAFTVPAGSKNVEWVSTKASNRGKAQVWLDGVEQDGDPSLTGIQPFDLYSSSTQLRRAVFSKAVDPTKSHKLEVKVLGQKNMSSTGTRVDVDAFVRTS